MCYLRLLFNSVMVRLIAASQFDSDTPHLDPFVHRPKSSFGFLTSPRWSSLGHRKVTKTGRCISLNQCKVERLMVKDNIRSKYRNRHTVTYELQGVLYRIIYALLYSINYWLLYKVRSRLKLPPDHLVLDLC